MKLNFKNIIDKLGLKQTEVAEKTGLSYPTINALYNGTAKSIYLDTLEKLCEVLNCTPNDVLIMDTNPCVVDSYSFNGIQCDITKKSANDLKDFEDFMLRAVEHHDAFNNAPTKLKYRKIKDENGKTMIVPYFLIDEDS